MKSKYSKIYTVFVAWKFFVKEKKLLDKYLAESNYRSKQSSVVQKKVTVPKRGLVDLDM